MKIAVLMSTFNGKQFIDEQIESILNQKNVEVVLYIRDDGSDDETDSIIKEYERKYNNIIYVNKNNRLNIGAHRSFFELIEYAKNNITDIDFFAFADQDDVWFENKMLSAINMILNQLDGKAINESPILYYSCKIWTDKNLNVNYKDSVRGRGDFFDMFTGVSVYGCTMVFNKKLLYKTLSDERTDGLAHDLYIARLAQSMKDSVILPDPEAYIFYRRHGNNLSVKPKKKNLLYILVLLKKRIFEKEQYRILRKYIIAIWNNNEEDLGDEARKLFELVFNYEKSFSKKMKLLFIKEVRKRGFKETIIWIGRVMFNAI